MTQLSDVFDEYLNTPKVNEEIIKIINNPYKPFTLNFLDFWEFSEQSANFLVNDAYEAIPEFQAVLKSRLNNSNYSAFHVVNYPNETSIRNLNGNQIGTLIKISGLIASVSEKELLLTKAVFICDECNAKQEIKITGQFLSPPGKCSKCHEGNMVIDPMRGESKQIQWLSLQERSEETPAGSPPQIIKLQLEGDMIYSLNPGDTVSAIGLIRGMRKRANDPNPNISIYLAVSSFEKDQQKYDITLTEEDKVILHELVQRIEFKSDLIRSIAPTLYGLDNEKLSIALQQCGGNVLQIDGERKRGSIHTLLVGDPGQGKSQLLDWAVKMNPRSIKIVGPGATSAGLTAATIKDEETGQYVLVAGAMILADLATVAADEFDKMRKEDRGSMHSAMEEQEVRVNKGGFNARMNSRCSLLAACNAAGGNWNTSLTLLENIKNFPPALISRFDLIWTLMNNRAVEEEMNRVDHVLNIRFNPENFKPPISITTLRKLFAYARTIRPQVSKETGERIREFYMQVLRASQKAESPMMTMRMLEGIARLTEASARLHLREEAVLEDAETAIKLVTESLLQSGIDPSTGRVDANMLETGIPSTLRGKIDLYLNTVKELQRMYPDQLVRESDLEDALIDKGFKGEEVKKIQGTLLREGTIFSPRPFFVKIT